MQAILFALISHIGWATGDIFGTIASRKIGAYSATFWIFFLGLVLFTLYIPFASGDMSKYTLQLVLLNLGLGLLYVGGNVVLNEAFARSSASLVGTINASFTALIVIFSVLFLHEPISLAQIIVISIIFIGVILCTLDFRDLRKSDLLSDPGIRLACVAALSFATYFTFIKLVVAVVGWFWPLYVSFWLFPFIFVYMRLRHIKLTSPLQKKSLAPILLSALLLRSGDFAFNFGLNNGLTAVVAPIAGSFPMSFVVLAFLVFKDPIKKQQIVGIVISIIGIVLLGIVSR